MRKSSYFNGIEEYLTDNFPIILNDDLEVNMDRMENDVDEDPKEEVKHELDQSTNTGLNGLTSFPLNKVIDPNDLEINPVVNNPHNSLFQSNGLFNTAKLEQMATLFHKLAIK